MVTRILKHRKLSIIWQILILNLAFSEAVDRHQRVANIRRKLHGEVSAEYAQSLNNLARAQEGMAAYEEALEGYQKSINIYQEVLGSYNADILKPTSNLGLLLSTLGRIDEGRDYQERALAVAERIFLMTIQKLPGF